MTNVTNQKRAVFFIVLCFSSNVLFAADNAEVALQKTEGRTEALVTAAKTQSEKPQRSFLNRAISAPGDAIVTTARFSSAIAGKVTDTTVKSVQTAGTFLFARIFKTLDILGQIKKRQSSKKG